MYQPAPSAARRSFIARLAKTLSFALLIGMVGTGTKAHSQDLQQALKTEVEFDKYWSLYLLQKVGCRLLSDGSIAQTITRADCQLPATIDAGSYYRARELAKKVFKLRDQ